MSNIAQQWAFQSHFTRTLPGDTVDGGRWTVDGGRWTVDGGRWTVDGRRQTVDGGRWTVDGQWKISGADSVHSSGHRSC